MLNDIVSRLVQCVVFWLSLPSSASRLGAVGAGGEADTPQHGSHHVGGDRVLPEEAARGLHKVLIPLPLVLHDLCRQAELSHGLPASEMLLSVHMRRLRALSCLTWLVCNSTISLDKFPS